MSMMQTDDHGNRQGDTVDVVGRVGMLLSYFRNDNIWIVEFADALGEIERISPSEFHNSERFIREWADIDFAEADGEIDLVG